MGGRALYPSVFPETSGGLLPPHPLLNEKDDVEVTEEGSYLVYQEFLNTPFPPVGGSMGNENDLS